MRYSKQRDIVYNNVLSRCDHPTALEIYNGLKNYYPKLSLGTVYRNLSSLVDAGLVKRVEVSSGHDRFDKTLMEHTHLLCVRCNSVTDVMFSLEDIINKEYNFRIISYNSLFRGICDKCLKKEERK